jgi:isoaspartyl peptidase/L-asparaginase-like protein (Ntn-hydrolase superfamily)
MELALSGSDTLDAAVEGVKIQELDPSDNSVGYGGLPNEDGVVQLDASCMHGPTRRAGAAGGTGGGEANMMACGGFLTVEHMRRGLSPTDACLDTLRRVERLTPARLIRNGRPTFQLELYAVNARGDLGAASFFPSRYAAHDGKDGALRDTAYLYPQAPA